MRDGIIILFTLFVVLSVLFVCNGLWSKIMFTIVTLSAAVVQLINGIKGYIAFPSEIAAAWVDYAKPVAWWVQQYNMFVAGAAAVMAVFFALHFIMLWLEKEKIIKHSAYWTAALAVAAALIIVISSIAYGVAHINKFFDFASRVLAIAVSASSVIVLYTATFVKWVQEKL